MDSPISIYVLAPILGWFFAHVAKFAIQIYKTGGTKFDAAIFFKSGGMPSSHSAVMIATLVVIGAKEGLDSAIFGLSVAVAAIVIYDAMNVRRSVGELGAALKDIVRKSEHGRKFFVAHGHTAAEVVGGIAVGLVVGFGLLQIL